MAIEAEIPLLDRRTFIRRGACLLAGAGIAVLGIGQAETLAFASEEPWSDKYWFPIGEATAGSRGIPRLDAVLDVYDKIAGTSFAQSAREFLEDYSRRFPGTLDYAGYCHGLAHAGLREPQPSRETTTFEGVELTYPTKVGLLVAFHSGDAMYRPVSSDDPQANFQALIGEFNQTGEAFVVDLPDKYAGQVGSWYRIYLGRGTFTDFGTANKALPVGWIRDAYRPYLEKDTGGLDQSKVEFVPDRLQNKWKFDLDAELVRQMAT